MELYPYMIQFLLSRYSVDEVLVQAYLLVTQCKALEGKSEQAYGRRLYKAAIRAGGSHYVVYGVTTRMGPNRNTESSYTGIVLRPCGPSRPQLRRFPAPADVGGGTPKSKPVSGVKMTAVKMPRATPAAVFHAEASGSEEEYVHAPLGDMSFMLKEFEVALANVRVDGGPPVSATPGASTPSWQMTPSSRSPPASVVSIPSRGWAIPAGSVRAQPALPRGGRLPRPEYGARPCVTSATSWDTGWPILHPYPLISGELRSRIAKST
jgi:hypothetical protein